MGLQTSDGNGPLASLPIAIGLVIFLLALAHSTRKANLRGRQLKKPPTVPYAIPWLGSALALNKDPDGFLRKAKEKYGEFFGLHIAGKKSWYAASPWLINSIYKDHKILPFAPIRMQYLEEIFGMSRKAATSSTVYSELFPVHHRLLAPTAIGPMLESFTRYTIQHLSQLRDSLTSDKTETDLPSFTHPVIFKAVSDMMMGPSFSAEKALQPFLDFDKAFLLLASGVPSIFVSKAIRARAELLQMLEEYLEGTWRTTSSEILVVAESIVKSDGMTNPDVAGLFLSEYWAVEGNLPWATYWVVALMLFENEGLAPLVREIDEARRDWLNRNPTSDPFPKYAHRFISEAHLPRLASVITETLRFTSSSFSVRRVGEGGAVVGGYELEKDEMVVCATRNVHLDDEIFPDASQFKPERYMDPSTKFCKDGKEIPHPLMSFGGGVSKCEGRFVAVHVMKAFTAILLQTFNIELDVNKPSKIEFDRSRIGVGIIPPKSPPRIVVTKRNDVY